MQAKNLRGECGVIVSAFCLWAWHDCGEILDLAHSLSNVAKSFQCNGSYFDETVTVVVEIVLLVLGNKTSLLFPPPIEVHCPAGTICVGKPWPLAKNVVNLPVAAGHPKRPTTA